MAELAAGRAAHDATEYPDELCALEVLEALGGALGHGALLVGILAEVVAEHRAELALGLATASLSLCDALREEAPPGEAEAERRGAAGQEGGGAPGPGALGCAASTPPLAAALRGGASLKPSGPSTVPSSRSHRVNA